MESSISNFDAIDMVDDLSLKMWRVSTSLYNSEGQEDSDSEDGKGENDNDSMEEDKVQAIVPLSKASSVSASPSSSSSSSSSFSSFTLSTLQLGRDKNQKSFFRRRKRRYNKYKEEYERRREVWLSKYGTLEALIDTFESGGAAKSGGGDLTPEQTRRLYHCLLPRSLLGLYELGVMDPEELAPLAFQARIAAKEYARYRCCWQGRLLTELFDTYRNIKRGDYQKVIQKLAVVDSKKEVEAVEMMTNSTESGTTDELKPGGGGGSKTPATSSSSLSWDELYQKYELQIVKEECAEELKGTDTKKESNIDEDDLTIRIYRRILEKSCQTNPGFDRAFLQSSSSESSSLDDEVEYLRGISQQLEQDIQNILLLPKDLEQIQKQQKKEEKQILKLETKLKKQERKAVEKFKKSKQKLLLKRQEEEERQRVLLLEKTRLEKAGDDEQSNPGLLQESSALGGRNDPNSSSSTALSADNTRFGRTRRWRVLRILAGSRHRFRHPKQL